MSNSFDPDYFSKQLAIQDENNRNFNLASQKYAEASLVYLANIVIDSLEKDKQIDSQTANIMRNTVSFIDNVGRLFRWW